MKEQDKLRIIAKVAGHPVPHKPTEEKLETGSYQFEPNYLTNYNAIIPVVVRWCDSNKDGWIRFCVAIRNHLGIVGTISIRELLHFTPEGIANMLIRAMGEWVE